jgi:hypothetical protein
MPPLGPTQQWHRPLGPRRWHRCVQRVPHRRTAGGMAAAAAAAAAAVAAAGRGIGRGTGWDSLHGPSCHWGYDGQVPYQWPTPSTQADEQQAPPAALPRHLAGPGPHPPPLLLLLLLLLLQGRSHQTLGGHWVVAAGEVAAHHHRLLLGHVGGGNPLRHPGDHEASRPLLLPRLLAAQRGPCPLLLHHTRPCRLHQAGSSWARPHCRLLLLLVVLLLRALPAPAALGTPKTCPQAERPQRGRAWGLWRLLPWLHPHWQPLGEATSPCLHCRHVAAAAVAAACPGCALRLPLLLLLLLRVRRGGRRGGAGSRRCCRLLVGGSKGPGIRHPLVALASLQT